MIKIFHTANGREVIDGRGIEPDVKIELDDLSRLTATLFRENIFFDYATKYYYDNQEIASADKFRLTEAEYKAFKDYVLAKEITYSTASEEKLKQMKETAEKEGFYEGLEAEYEALMSKVHPSTERDLDKFEKEIRTILENEIVSRYYFQTGRAKYNFQDDDYVNKAVEVLQNKSEYNTILGF